VSGGEAGAIGASLSIMIGGKAAAVERAMPIFQALGKNIVHVGEAGAGQVAKAANQVVVGITIAAVSEALVLAAKAGVDPGRCGRCCSAASRSRRSSTRTGKKCSNAISSPAFASACTRKI
jgi:2-hydroxy-3-oxopropionate reductase